MAEGERIDADEFETTVLEPTASEHPTQVMPALPTSPQVVIPASAAQPPAAPHTQAVQPSQPAAGWYQDPWVSPGTPAAMRYWDGSTWTAHASHATIPPKRLGIPGWVLALTWFLVAALAVGVFFFVLMIAAFACDSGWEGCSQAAADGVAAYVIVTAAVATVPPVVAVIIGRGKRLGRALRVLAIVVMPLSVVAGVAATFVLISSRLP